MTVKSKPHYLLQAIKAQMTTVNLMYPTISSQDGIRDLGMTMADALAVVQGLTRNDFEKSMTTNGNYKVWQDVYKPTWNGIPLYVKFQQATNNLYYFVISFKENTE